MANKVKRISVNAFEKAVSESSKSATTVVWHGLEITVKRTLSISEMIGFVDDVLDLCFIEERGYTPEIFDFAVKMGVLTRYANFTMPKNIRDQYALVCGSGVAEFVGVEVNQTQLREIIASAKQRIEHKLNVDSRMQAMKKVNEVIDLVLQLGRDSMDKIGEVNNEEFGDMLDLVRSAGSDGTSMADSVVASYLQHLKDEADVATPCNITEFPTENATEVGSNDI